MSTQAPGSGLKSDVAACLKGANGGYRDSANAPSSWIGNCCTLALQHWGNDSMDRIVTIAVTALSLGIFCPDAVFAQTAKDLAGTWLPVSATLIRQDGSKIDPFSQNLKGILNFDNSGRFAFILTRPDLPKFASNNRNTGTAEENRAIVQGSLAYFGTYSLAEKTIKMHVEGGTWPGWTGTDIERIIFSFSGDELKWTDPTPSVGGKAENVWRRAN
jgi:hypothetical protein